MSTKVCITIQVEVTDLDLSGCRVYPPNGLHDGYEVDTSDITFWNYEVVDCDYDSICRHLVENWIEGKEYERSEMMSGREDMAKH